MRNSVYVRFRHSHLGRVLFLLTFTAFALTGQSILRAERQPSEIFQQLESQLICPCGCGEILKVCECDTSDQIRRTLQEQIRRGMSLEQIRQDYAKRHGSQYVIVPAASSGSQRVEKCGQCHDEAPETQEWLRSAHAQSLRSLSKPAQANSSCLSCHSSDYRQAEQVAQVWGQQTLRAAVRVREHDPVACSACHRHDAPYQHYLVLPPDKLCESCHQRTKG